MHTSEPEYYIKKYASIPSKTQKKVVLSFTVKPTQEKYLKPLVNSILDQTVRVNQIYLNVPETENIQIPTFMKDVVSVMECGRDYGEANKFIPTILREHDSNTILIFLSYKHVYGKDFIETLLAEHEKDLRSTLISGYAILTTPSNVLAKEVLNPDIKNDLPNAWITSVLKNKRYIPYNKNFKSIF